MQPIGVSDKIVISGPGLFRICLNQEKLTKEKVCENPFKEKSLVMQAG